MIVGEVARSRAGAGDAGVRDQNRAFGYGQYVVDQRLGGMGQVDQHALLLQAGDYLAAQRGQPAFDQAMGRATDLVVEEVSQAGDAKAGVIQAV